MTAGTPAAAGPGGALHVGVVGLRFGEDFVPIYQRHPLVRAVSVVDSDPERLATVAGRFGAVSRHRDLSSLLADSDVDAVHILTPVSFHREHAVAVLRTGRYCACAVPMATSLEDIEAIIQAQGGRRDNYMMMETSVYSREYMYVEQLAGAGAMGDLTFYRGYHMQDLDGYPPYWLGYPPMHYVTHALAPALALTGTSVRSVHGAGSGRLAPERRGAYDNPFPLEAGLFRLRGHDMAVDVTMSFFQAARAYTEGFSVYGTKVGVEWPVAEGGPLQVHELGEVRETGRGRSVSVRAVEPPDQVGGLPPEVAAFTRPLTLDGLDGYPGSAGVMVPSHHGGSHPHLVHEWLTSIVEGRPARVDARRAAAWTAPGICAHRSALEGGSEVTVPDYD